jgi:hypothetical protein
MKLPVVAVSALILLLTGCASHKSYNQTTTGIVVLRGGRYQKDTWEQSLVFKRMSWYHGMTLYYDALLYKADANSPFAKWFSPTEKEFFSKCESVVVTATYSADPTKISHVSFREQMKLNGYDDIVLNNFTSYIKSHPSAVDWRIANYKLLGYCKRSPTRQGTPRLVINFPSFRHLEVEL